MKPHQNYHFFLLFLLILNYSCKKGDAPIPPPEPKVLDVYLVGSEENASGKHVAKYWKNGIPVALTDGSSDAVAYDIDVLGEDVYISGFIRKGNDDRDLILWKNETPIKIGSNKYAIGSRIKVTGTETNPIIYIGGVLRNSNNKKVAAFWKITKSDTTETILGNSNSHSQFEGIEVVNDNVYIVYSQDVSYHKQIRMVKNGDDTAITPADSAFIASGLAVSSSGDVYISGMEYNIIIDSKARCWKNGIQIPISDVGRTYTGGIALSGEDVYIGGTYNSLSGIKLGIYYWKNGEAHEIKTPYTINYAEDIAIYNDDIYLVGYSAPDEFLTRTAMVWKNDIGTGLTDGENSAAILGIDLHEH